MRLADSIDMAFIRELAADPRNAEFFRHMPPVAAWPTQAYAWFQSCFVLEKDGQSVGLVQISNLNQVSRTAEFGIVVLPGHRELFMDGLEELGSYLFGYLGMNKVTTRTLAHRRGLHKALERRGFKRDGVLRQNVFFNGRFEDEVVHSLLKEEYVRS